MKRAILALLLGFSLAGSAFAGFEDGMAAWRKGDFKTAASEFRALAERGHAQAQNNLGYMYENGEGVPRSDAKAAKWYGKAAAQGITESQNSLGLMYAGGRGGLELDNVEALKWLFIAAARGDSFAKFNRDSIKKKMSPEDIAKAESLGKAWLSANPK